MKFTSNNNIFEEPLNEFDEEKNFVLAKRLEDENYAKPSHELKNWYLVRTFEINRYKLTSNYIHLLEQEQFDEK